MSRAPHHLLALCLAALLPACGDHHGSDRDAGPPPSPFLDQSRQVGTASYGQGVDLINFLMPAKYATIAFTASAGDPVDVWVRGPGVQANAWLLDGSGQPLAQGGPGNPDTHVAATVEEAGAHYIAFELIGGYAGFVRVELGLGGHSLSGWVGPVKGAASVALVRDARQVQFVTVQPDGTFRFDHLIDGDYRVTPASSSQAFLPVSRDVTVAGADVGEVEFRRPGPQISGTVTGPVGDLTLSRDASAVDHALLHEGRYVFAGVANGHYTVTPTRSGCTFVPPSADLDVSGGDVKVPAFQELYSISGTVRGGGAGLTVTLDPDGASRSTSTDESGAWSFTAVAAGAHRVVLAGVPGFDARHVLADETIWSDPVAGDDFDLVAQPLAYAAPSAGEVVTAFAADAAHLYFAIGPATAGAAAPHAGLYRAALGSPGSATPFADGFHDLVALAVDPQFLYWASATAVGRLPLTGGAGDLLASGRSGIAGLAIDQNHAHWTETGADGTSHLLSVPLSRGPVVRVADGLDQPGSLVSDGNTLYWTTPAWGSLESAPVGGGALTWLGHGTTGLARGLALSGGLLYLLTSSGLFTIAPGTRATTQVLPDLADCRAIAVDAGRIYCARGPASGAGSGSDLSSLALDGHDRRLLALGLAAPDRILIAGGRAYWSDRSLGLFGAGTR